MADDLSQPAVKRDLERAEPLVLERRLMTPFLSKKVPPVPDDDNRKPYPWASANPISKAFFWWLNPIMKVGYKRTLTPNDMYELTPNMRVDHTYEVFARNLHNGLMKFRAAEKKKDPSLTDDELAKLPYPKTLILKSLFLTFKWEYSIAIFFKVLADVSNVCNPLLSKKLITFVEEKEFFPDLGVGKGVGYAIATTAILILNGIFLNQFLHLSMTTGAHCKGILTAALLKKSFMADAETRHKFSSGRITSLMSTDLSRIDRAIGLQPFGLTVPIPVIISIALLIVNIGVSSLAGIAVFIIALGGIGVTAKSLLKLRRTANKHTDKRISLMREILQSMKIIKFYSWEDAYEASVVKERDAEVNIMLRMQSIRNFMLAFAISLPSFTSMVAFLVLYAVRTNRSPADIFPSVSLFGSLAQQTMMLPMALATGTDMMIGIGRVAEYLQSGTNLKDPESLDEDDSQSDEKIVLPDDIAIKSTNASFIWEKFENEQSEDSSTVASNEKSSSSDVDIKHVSSSTDAEEGHDGYTKDVFEGFHNINLEIKKGEFVIITGPIGSGKSSLLIALAGFMKRTQGTLSVNGSALLCGQPWVQNATVKENIIFGLPIDDVRYQRVLDVCALRDDLKMFIGGDLTEIGERGITLSGGQKARINLARAVYADKDIVLFDDILSAVDARVGKQIVDECLGEFMKGKTRVLATHQLSLVEQADRIIYLNGDGTIHTGTLQELLADNKGFVRLMEFSKKPKEEGEDAVHKDKEEALALQKSRSIAAVMSEEDHDEAAGVIGKAEERAKNRISFSVYKDYLREGGGIFGVTAGPLALLLLVLDVFTSIFINVWLSFWVSYKWKFRSNGFYIGIYVMLVIINVAIIATCFVLMGYISTTSARGLNLKAMKRVLHSPMVYLDVTPMGRILNRFTKDTDVLDNELGEQIRLFLHPSAFVVGVVILCIIYLPWFALSLPPLIILCACITDFYQSSSREIKRLEAVQRSLVYNNFNEMLNGMMTLKSYRATTRFLEKNKRLVDRMNESYFVVIANQRWISINLDMVAAALLFVVSMLTVTRQFSISAASAGLIVTYVLQIGGMMSLIMRAYTTVENEMNSVERLCQYANDLEQENPYHINETHPAPTWPEEGAIEFQNVSLRYREGLPLVLKNLSMSIKGGEKIGICGRTGAGKSSIMTALYRLSELAGGSILIDGVNISKLGMFELRSKLSIIPQDPVLFLGTIRSNLDPFGQSDDEHLWDALRRSDLIDHSILETVKAQTKDDPNFHKFHLDQPVEDEGSNFSLGERQLLALARALVRNSRILILDEATSSVDYETDSKVQATITKEFDHCTILCIAHRLKTILTYDRILVLEQGEIEEFDTPLALYENDGIFKRMCEKSRITRDSF